MRTPMFTHTPVPTSVAKINPHAKVNADTQSIALSHAGTNVYFECEVQATSIPMPTSLSLSQLTSTRK